MNIDVAKLIERASVGALQWRVVALCSLIGLMDGFDLQVMALLIPRIAAEWGRPAYSFGLTLSASFAGIMAGAMIFGMLGDRFGRRRTLIGAFALVGAASLLSAGAESAAQLIALRFLTGLGVGGCMPNSVALIAEYVPAKRVGWFVAVLYSAVPIGGVLAGAFAGEVADQFGWRAVFIVGGSVPLLVCGVLLVGLPESLRFLVRRGARDAQIGAILQRIDAGYRYSPEHRFIEESVAEDGSPRALFAMGRARATLALWATFFFSLACLYVLTSWLPTVLVQQGWPMNRASQSVSFFWLGGIFGGLAVGWLMDRVGRHKVLAGAFAAAAALTFAIGVFAGPSAQVLLVIALTGFAVVGAQTGTTALAASTYPTAIRSTGVGWGLGIGRLGAVISPILGGLALAAGWAQTSLFVAAAAPMVICTVAILTAAAMQLEKVDISANGET